jgi:hypothetical protein
LRSACKNAETHARREFQIESFTRPFVDAKSREEIERWNREWLSHEPQGESAKAFQGLRAQIAPDRTGVTTCPDLLDIDEKRRVPRRAASVAEIDSLLESKAS